MNRAELTKATSPDDAPVPQYIMEDICRATYESEKDAEKMADFLIRRIQKSNLNTKLKAASIIAHCIREGNEIFGEIMQECQVDIKKLTEISGPPDPIHGEEKYRLIRLAGQDCMDALFSSRRKSHPPSQEQSDYNSSYSQQPDYNREPGYNPQQNYQGGGYGNPQQQWGSSQPNPQQQWGSSQPNPQQQWGSSQPNPQQQWGSSQPNPHHQWGSGQSNPQQQWGSSQPNPQQQGYEYGGSQQYSSSQQNTRGYSMGQHQQPQEPSSYDNFGKGGWGSSRKSGGGMGVWGSSGFQKNTPQADSGYPPPGGYGGPMGMNGAAPPRPYNPRDNRPTVLVNQNKQTWKDRMKNKFQSNTSTYTNTNPVKQDNFGSKVSNWRKQGMHELNEARGKWYGRNMDKSVTSSLADNDSCLSAETVPDRGYQPHMLGNTGGGDTSGEYEKSLIENLCAPAGLGRAPPADALKRFVDLAQTLDVYLIGELIQQKLDSSSWQARLKALHVIEALLEAPGCTQYGEWFEENNESLQQIANHDKRGNVRTKASQILETLGLSIEAPSRQPKIQHNPVQPSPSSSGIDLLQFEGLQLNSPANAADVSPSMLQHQQPVYQQFSPANQSSPNLLGSFSSNSPAAPDAYSQEPNLLDPFGSNENPIPQISVSDNPTGTRESRSLSDVGKDLFNVATSPLPNTDGQGNTTSAFDFLGS